MDKTFEVTRSDRCIYIRDLRTTDEQVPNPKHIVPEQAEELIRELQEVLAK